MSREGQIAIFGLIRKIIELNPHLTTLNLSNFSTDDIFEESLGELVLQCLLSSSIDSIIDLDLGGNASWFEDERESNVELLADVCIK